MYLKKEYITLPLPPIDEFNEAQQAALTQNPHDFYNTYEFLNVVIVFMVKNHSERIRLSNKRTIFIYDQGNDEVWIESNSNRRGFRFRIIENEPVLLNDLEFSIASVLDRDIVQSQRKTVLSHKKETNV